MLPPIVTVLLTTTGGKFCYDFFSKPLELSDSSTILMYWASWAEKPWALGFIFSLVLLWLTSSANTARTSPLGSVGYFALIFAFQFALMNLHVMFTLKYSIPVIPSFCKILFNILQLWLVVISHPEIYQILTFIRC